jgi:hypothetical protein
MLPYATSSKSTVNPKCLTSKFTRVKRCDAGHYVGVLTDVGIADVRMAGLSLHLTNGVPLRRRCDAHRTFCPMKNR